jgi:RNA polymerase sigma factor (TIGR02999 family)
VQSRFVRCADSTGLYTVTTLMSTPDLPSEVSGLLEAINRGEPQAAKQLLPLVYVELRRLARSRLAREAPGQTLDATALVHEAYLRLVGDEPGKRWNGRRHFFGAAAEAMRRILVENARRKHAQKHGGGLHRVALDHVEPADRPLTGADDLLALDEALTRFAGIEPAKAELIKLRYFGGLALEDSAAILEISPATAKRWWNFARAWLFDAIEGHHEVGPAPTPE